MNIEQAKNTSRSFQKAYQRAIEPRELEGGKFEMLTVPAIVCAAFSIEIGMKALINDDRKENRHHNLKTLFLTLKTEVQTDIRAHVGLPNQEFDSLIESVEQSFDKWRYIHEATDATSINVGFLGKLLDAVQSQLK